MWKALLKKIFKARDKFALNLGKEDEEKPFLEHLEDLRTMIVRMVITLLIAVIGTFVVYDWLFMLIRQPLVTAGICKDMSETINYLRSNGPSDAFMAMVNIAMIAGIIVSFPLLMLFLLQFILPGLKDTEKKMLFPAIAIGAGLFLSGVAFSYFLVLPRALEFFESFGRSIGVRQDWTLDSYVTFSTRFVLVFGVSFELPVLVMALVKLDVLNYRLMISTWKHALVAIAVFAAVITPTQDVLTLVLMAGPLYILYAICVWLAYFMEKKDREANPEYYAELDKDAAEMEKTESTDDWDKDDYNPWSTGDDDDEDDDEGYKKPAPKPANSPSDGAAPEALKPDSEKTLEDFAAEDEGRKNTD